MFEAIDAKYWLMTLPWVGLGLGVVLLIVAVSEWKLRGRTRELARLARSLGWTFQPMNYAGRKPATRLPPKLDASLRTWFPRFRFSGPVQNSMRGLIRGRDVLVADLWNPRRRYGSGGTIVAVLTDALRLPSFCLLPKGRGERAGILLGLQDVEFADDPEFSKQFWLRSEEEEAIRDRLNSTLRRYCAAHPKVGVIGSDGCVTVFHEFTPAPAAEIPSLIEYATSLAKLLTQAKHNTALSRSRPTGG